MDSTHIDTIAKLDMRTLDGLQIQYRAKGDHHHADLVGKAIAQKAGGAAQTSELDSCGKLFRHTQNDPDTGRVMHTFTGDMDVWLNNFKTPGMECRFDNTLFSGANSPGAKARAASQVTVTVQPGERVVIVPAGKKHAA